LGFAYKDARARYEILKYRRRDPLVGLKADALKAPEGTRAHLHNGRQDELPELERPWRSRGPGAGECINWVSRLDTNERP